MDKKDLTEVLHHIPNFKEKVEIVFTEEEERKLKSIRKRQKEKSISNYCRVDLL